MTDLRRAAPALAAILLAAAVAANAYVSLHSVDVLDRGFSNETRPADVQRTLLGLRSALQDAETGQRGYLLTGERAYLAPYETARPQADSLYDRLDSLVSWNPLQVRRLPGLRAATDAKFAELAETLRLYDEVGPEASLAVVRQDRGQRLMDEVRTRLDEMDAEATRVRSMFSARADRALADARRSAWLSTAALAGLLLLLGLGVRADGRRRERHAAGLAQANAALSTALGEREAALGRVRSMQGQLVQQEKLAAMGRLTAGVAHEIKNPLNFVANFASLSAELADEAAAALDQGDRAEAADALVAVRQNAAKILQHSHRADDIVNAMLVHARGVAGVRRPVDVAGLLDAAATQAGGPQGHDGVALSVEVDPALDSAEVVAESVTRAVRNLVENAVHAVRERAGAGDPSYRPTVRVWARPGTDHDGRAVAVVTVADNGAGIPDDLFPRIFEPFFTTKGPGSGTGLGLSLAHDIAVGHGGSLLAERPVTGGTAFVLTLPLAAVDMGPDGLA